MTENLVANGDWFPRLTADGDDGSFRRDRLLIVAGFLRGKLGEDLFNYVHALHDHKGELTATLNCSERHQSVSEIVAAVVAAWELVNEYEVVMRYAP